MANMCSNFFTITGGNKQEIFDEMVRIANEQQTVSDGQKAFGIGEEWMFDVVVGETNETINFETRWSPNISDLVEIAKLKNFQFELEAEEQNNGVYVGYKFDGKTLFERSLEWEEIDLVEYDEENDCYLFNGEEIESEAEQYEILLSAKPFQEVVKPQINQ